jgi:hypothetical protein
MPARLFYGAAQQAFPFRRISIGIAMSIELSRIELSGLGGHSSGRPGRAASSFRPGYVWLAAALVASMGAWVLLSGYAEEPDEGETVGRATAVAAVPAPLPAATAEPAALNPPTTAGEGIAPEEAAPVDALKISSQRWQRGGLGSKALVTFTLRNGNDYTVTDIAISCVFSRRDGSHLTDRVRMIHETVNMKSRKTFTRLHVGFVNVNASRAKCSPVAARHV